MQFVSNRAFTMLEAVITLAIVVIGVSAGTSFMRTQMRAQKRIADGFDALDANRYISERIDCRRTIDVLKGSGRSLSQCAANSELITVYGQGATSGVLVSGTATQPTKFGRWVARPRCAADGIILDVAIPVANATSPLTLTDAQSTMFQKDPLTGKVLNWSGSPRLSSRPFCGAEFDEELNPRTTSGNATPNMQCRFFDKAFNRTTTPLSSNGHTRLAHFSCPSDYPVAVSVAVEPACNALEWFAITKPQGASYPNVAMCAVSFYQDSSISLLEKQQRENNCSAIGANPDIARCRYLCCHL